jgi:hypothetical protein
MWQLTYLTIRQAQMDFSGTDQPPFSGTGLWAEGVELINIVELVNWKETPLQFIICTICGCVGCKPKDWVDIKQSHSVVLIMPAFLRIDQAGETMGNEYLPPDYLVKRGIICIKPEIYLSHLCQLAAFPKFENLAPLSAWEASKIFQLEAPSRVMGDLLNPPTLAKDMVIASSEGDFREQTKELVSLVNKLSKEIRPANLRPITEHDQIISLYIDIQGVPEWKALSYNGSQYSLYLEPGYIIE